MNKISLTNYLLRVDIYEKTNLDFFSFLILQIADHKDTSNTSLIDYLKEVEISSSLLYLFEKQFYELIDNDLIEAKRDDFSIVLIDDLSITNQGKEVLLKNYLLDIVGTKEIDLSINPIDDTLTAFKDTSKVKEYELIEKTYTEDEINVFVNQNKSQIFDDKSDDYYYHCHIKVVNPLLISN